MTIGTTFALVLLATMTGLVLIQVVYAGKIRTAREDASALWMSPFYDPETTDHHERRALALIHSRIDHLRHERDHLSILTLLAAVTAVGLSASVEYFL